MAEVIGDPDGHDHVDSSAAYIHVAPLLREEFDAARARLLWRELPRGPMAADMAGFLAAAAELGFTERSPGRGGSQVVGRVLIQTGRGLGQRTEADLDELPGACRQRQDADGI